MNIIFLDAETFNIDLPPIPNTHWQSYDYTPQDDAVIVERLQNADVVFVNKVQLTREILAQLPKLKLIQITATGMNNVDLQACEDLNIACKNVSGYAEDTVPEHTFALLFNLTRNIAYYHQVVQQGDWEKSRQFCLIDRKNRDLKGKTLGIIGYGTTGQKVATFARVFGMQVLVAEHRGKTPRNENYTAFEDVLARADVLSLHCPLTPQTEQLINAETIALMSRQPIILNLARGPVIDETAVAEAIQSGKLSGFATDVLSTEPPNRDNPILCIADRPDVVITPHNAWSSVEAQSQLWQMGCAQVEAFLAEVK